MGSARALVTLVQLNSEPEISVSLAPSLILPSNPESDFSSMLFCLNLIAISASGVGSLANTHEANYDRTACIPLPASLQGLPANEYTRRSSEQALIQVHLAGVRTESGGYMHRKRMFRVELPFAAGVLAQSNLSSTGGTSVVASSWLSDAATGAMVQESKTTLVVTQSMTQQPHTPQNHYCARKGAVRVNWNHNDSRSSSGLCVHDGGFSHHQVFLLGVQINEKSLFFLPLPLLEAVALALAIELQ